MNVYPHTNEYACEPCYTNQFENIANVKRSTNVMFSVLLVDYDDSLLFWHVKQKS